MYWYIVLVIIVLVLYWYCIAFLREMRFSSSKYSNSASVALMSPGTNAFLREMHSNPATYSTLTYLYIIASATEPRHPFQGWAVRSARHPEYPTRDRDPVAAPMPQPSLATRDVSWYTCREQS